ncbi:MAG: hypothetical protein Q9165_000143 [Trypethelium subeluteriae]
MMSFNGSPARRKPAAGISVYEDEPGLTKTTSTIQDQKLNLAPCATGQELDKPTVEILAGLSEQQELLEKQQQELKAADSGISPISVQYSDASPAGSVGITPDTETFATTPKTEDGSNDSTKDSDDEVRRLREELTVANNRIAKMDEELTQTRITKHTLDQAMGTASEFNLTANTRVHDPFQPDLNGPLSASSRSNLVRTENWMAQQDDARSDITDPLGAAGIPLNNQLWGKPGLSISQARSADQSLPLFLDQQQAGPTSNRAWSDRNIAPEVNQPPFVPTLHCQRSMNFRSDKFGGNFVVTEPASFGGNQSLRRQNQTSGRPASNFGSAPNSAWTSAPTQMNWSGKIEPSPSITPYNAEAMQATYGPVPSYLPRPIGTRLSPTASEFNASTIAPTPWNAGPPSEPAPTYMPTVEPLNYRRLLDRNMNCNWTYIVDKIVCNNDQQASIFLQQKLKVGTPEQKYEIVQAIIGQAYSLMVNRFGNFLVQRCFEHGTTEQIIAIAKAIRGNTLNLSMDAFGCHVVQKAFDAVPEEYKASMVHELLNRIPETVIHRYACHVWQKLFELRWSDSPPLIMCYVNEALCGMWHEVALGETGSLVVQNIFENCLEEDKRPCINEVLASIDVVAHGQFGNWCIQHICEHGAPADRSRAIDHVLRFATEYSTDQFASKVVEKCLKVGGPAFLERYLERVTEGRHDRPRMPLIDTHSDGSKHMVSLRGSKYGSRVAMLCCNPASSTRPGPPGGLPLNRGGSYNSGGMRALYGGAYRC